jgi:hypothetical protein
VTARIQICIAVFLVSALRGPDSGTGFGPGFESIALARSLVTHGTYSDPFGAPTGPSAHTGPVFPAFLAAHLWVFGDGPRALIALLFFACAAAALHAVLLFEICSRIFANGTAGWIAAGISCLVFPVVPHEETPYTACAILGFVLLSRGGRGLYAGALAGLLALLSQATLAFTVPLLLYRACQRRSGRWLGAALVALAALCLPWTLRNYAALGQPILIRDNLGMELYVANSDLAARGSSYMAMHPWGNPRELDAVRQMGEVAYNRDRLGTALRWIRNHPRTFLGLTAKRCLGYWFPANPALRVLTILGLAGLPLAFRRMAPELIAALVLFPAVYYLVQAQTGSYRYPVLWASIIPAGVFLTAVASRLLRRGKAAAAVPG